MRVLLKSLTIIFTIFAFVPSAIATQDSLDNQINKIVNQIDPHINVGMVVLPLNKEEKLSKPYYVKNENRFYTLASTTKIFTALSSLLNLGPNYSFKTEIYHHVTSDRKHHLYIKFDGDPTLSSDQIHTLLIAAADALPKNITIEKIYITAPDRQFSYHAPGWMIGDTFYCYAAPVASMILDQNCLDLDDHRQFAMARKAKINFNVKTQKRAPGSLDDYLELKLNHIITKVKKFENAEIAFGFLPENSKIMAELTSDPVYKILYPILKDSENLPSDALFLKMGQRAGLNEWGPTGEHILLNLEEKLDINLQGSLITDGSGLSRYNASSPLQFSRLLEKAYYTPQIKSYFLPALAQLGVDGSLKARHKKSDLNGMLRAKTGSMTGVVTLAGYLSLPNDKNYVVILFLNNFSGKNSVYKNMQDQILDAVYADLSKNN